MGNKTTTTELIDAVAAATGLSRADVGRVLDGFKAVVTNGLNEGNAVAVAGLGTFKPKHRPARQARNPRTGEMVDVTASNTAGFTPAKALRDALNR